MESSVTVKDHIAVFSFSGRLDTLGAREAQEAFEAGATTDVSCAVFDLTGVKYLSSAGVRVFLNANRTLAARGGLLALAGAGEYVAEVLKLTGLIGTLPLFPSQTEARAACRASLREKYALDNWDRLETASESCGTFRFAPGSVRPAKALVLGRVKNVLDADITQAMVYSRRLSETEYSLGLGGLGGDAEDYFQIMGEMMTIGGAMVWLPADGSDAPDFLIPKSDAGEALLHTPFNVSLSGEFNEFAMFTCESPGGVMLTELYRGLFRLAARRRPDFKGVIGLAAWADMEDVYGTGVKIAPVAENAPENREMITHPANAGIWFERDKTPRHQNVSCLLCGLGVDLGADLSSFAKNDLDAIFYVSPGEAASKTELLHTHGVVMARAPLPERMSGLDREVKKLLDVGEFLDMRHVLGVSRVRKAFLGISYIQELDRERREGVEEVPVDMKRLRAMAMARYMQFAEMRPAK